VRILLVFLRFLPALIVLGATVVFFFALLNVLIRNEQWLIGKLMCLGLWLVFIWIIFLLLPDWMKRPLRAIGRGVGKRMFTTNKNERKHR